MSKPALQLIAENKRVKSPALDLSQYALTELPKALFNCVWLEELILSSRGIEDGRRRKSKNSLDDHHFSSLPPGFAKLKNLKKLVYCGERSWMQWKVSDLSALSGLVNLKTLDLSYNQISDLSALSGLVNLESLNLSNNQLSDLSVLSELVNLKTLDLSYNQISDLSALSGLVNLENLMLNFNQLNDLSGLSGLINLKNLDVMYNQINDLSPLSGLRQLTELCLGGNQISDLSPLSGLIHLTELNVVNNRITDVPPELTKQFPMLEGILPGGNTLAEMPGNITLLPDVKNYLRDIQKGNLINNQFNLGLIGNSGVGKTQIVKRLAERQNFVFDENHQLTRLKTILLGKLDNTIIPQGMELILSDLGGCVFSSPDLHYFSLMSPYRKVLLLVWENGTNPVRIQRNDGKVCPRRTLEGWFKYFNEDWRERLIIVVQNKTDLPQNPGLSNQQMEQYKKSYPSLRGFVQVSAKTGEGFDALEESIARLFEQDQQLRNIFLKRLPTSWVAVRRELEKWKLQGRKQVHTTEFYALCKQYEVAHSSETILKFLSLTDLFTYREKEQQIIFDYESVFKKQ